MQSTNMNVSDCKYVESILDTETIVDNYKNTPFQEAMEKLARSNTKIRRVKRDGNCFYSSIIFLLLEHYLKNPSLSEELLRRLDSANAILREQSVEEYLIEEFIDPIFSIIKSTVAGNTVVLEELDTVFWNYTVTYFRMITSSYIKKNPELFLPFLGVSVEEYCAQKIEAIGQYAGEVELTSLSMALEVSFTVISLEKGKTSIYTKGEKEKIGALLYMPDHFDIIYDPFK
ncbi:ubiquitin thioesterase protein OTUB1 [Nematocida sp. LUAm3]|nr:ubiquitin thioesterase protein OTUB1 [Nematocida sp. LUAm3]KAI5178185.1 ubiquitin thioesterase protein OTUB1 [Nematocida sp. LUAm1]